MRKAEQANSRHRTILHVCDFDGTLTRGDTLLRFLLFAVSWRQLVWGSLVLFFTFSRLVLRGNWSNSAGKTALVAQFFKGKPESEMRRLGHEFFQKKLPGLLRQDLLGKLRSALQKGDSIAIVSASFDIWLEPFCKAEGFDLLCTRLEFTKNPQIGTPFADEPRFSGRFANLNCNRAEKARRIREAYRLESFEKVIAYGNSRGDAEMFELADEVFKF